MIENDKFRRFLEIALVVLAVFFIALAIVKSDAKTADDEGDRQPVIDMHMHATPMAFYGNRQIPHPTTGETSAVATDEDMLRVTLEQMKRYNIVKAVLSGPDYDLVQHWREAAPGRFFAGVWVDGVRSPEDPKRTPKALRLAYENGHLQVMGEITGQYQGVAVDDPRLAEYFALAAEMDLPVTVHMGMGTPGSTYWEGPCCSEFRARFADPLRLEEVLNRHPDLKIYISHAAWPFGQELKNILLLYPNVYVDIAAIPWNFPEAELENYLVPLIEAGFGKRIMFGSDTLAWPDINIPMAIGRLENADYLSAEQKRDILYNNAARFLGITEDTD